MNALNLAALLGDIPLSKIQLGQKVTSRLNDVVSPEYGFDVSFDGHDIELMYHQLTDALKKEIDELTLLTVLETQVVISDITLVRQSSKFREEQSDKKPNVIISIFTICMLLAVIYEIFLVIASITSTNGKVEGVIYDMIKGVIKFISGIVSLI